MATHVLALPLVIKINQLIDYFFNQIAPLTYKGDRLTQEDRQLDDKSTSPYSYIDTPPQDEYPDSNERIKPLAIIVNLLPTQFAWAAVEIGAIHYWVCAQD